MRDWRVLGFNAIYYIIIIENPYELSTISNYTFTRRYRVSKKIARGVGLVCVQYNIY